MIYWMLLFIAISTEVAAQTFLKLSGFWSKLIPSGIAIVLFGTQFLIHSYVISKLNISSIYPVWSGFGTVLMAIVGVLVFKESITLQKGIFIVIIIIGITGLCLSDVKA